MISARYVLDRLPGAKLQPFRAETSWEPARVRATIPSRSYILRPGAPRLGVFKHPTGVRHWELRQFPGNYSVMDNRLAEGRFVLHAQDFYLRLPVEVTKPGPIRCLDTSGRWKRVRPSRRRHMKSWRFAPCQEKLWYAPLYRRGRFPYGAEPWAWPPWAKHPHQLRRVCVGWVEVMFRLCIFRQDSDDLEPHLRRLEMQLQREMMSLLSQAEIPPPQRRAAA